MWTRNTSIVQTTAVGGGVKISDLSGHSVYNLDLEHLKSVLDYCPPRKSGDDSTVVISIPTIDDTLLYFKMWEVDVLSEDSKDRYPDIRAYAGVQVGGTYNIRANTSSNIFDFSVNDENRKTVLTNRKLDGGDYLIADDLTYAASNTEVVCCNREEHIAASTQTIRALAGGHTGTRTFPIILSTLPGFSEYYIPAGNAGDTDSQKRALVVAGLTTIVNEANALFESELGINFLLSPLDALIYLPGDDVSPYPAGNPTNPGDYIELVNADFVDKGATGSYSLGHLLGNLVTDPGFFGASGLAALGVVGNPTQKERAVTLTSDPTGVWKSGFNGVFWHEIGHQFNAQHTFSYNSDPPGRSASTSVEPGAGVTLMSYGRNNVAGDYYGSGTYLHHVSIKNILEYISANSPIEGMFETPNATPVPSADAGSSYTIPHSTAYKLTSGDTINPASSFNWEQVDPIGLSATVDSTNFGHTRAEGALARSFTPSSNNYRYVPTFSRVLSGDLTSTLPAGDAGAWETVSTVPRVLNWGLTVKTSDTGGIVVVSYDSKTITVDSTGPFQVSGITGGTSWETGTSQPVTWDAAGGTALAENVKISLSVDSGVTYPHVLSASTPNNGSATVTIPIISATSTARVMVEAIGNIFLAVNGSDFGISVNTNAPDAPLIGSIVHPAGGTGDGTVEVVDFEFDNPSTYTIYGDTGATILPFTPSGATGTMGGTFTIGEGTYRIQATRGGITSLPSSSVTVGVPVPPTIGTITHPTVSEANGTFAISDYSPVFVYNFSPTGPSVNISTGIVTATSGSYTVTATNGAGTSASSEEITINAQPVVPDTPTIGTITHPVGGGSGDGVVQVINYDASNTYVTTPVTSISFGPTGGNMTIGPGTYTLAATKDSLTSPESDSFTVNSPPTVPDAPTIGTITQPTFNEENGFFVVGNFDPTFTYDFSPTGPTISGATGEEGLVTAPTGSFTVTATNSVGTSPASESFVVEDQPIAAPTFGPSAGETGATGGTVQITNYSVFQTYEFSPTGPTISGVTGEEGLIYADSGSYDVITTKTSTGVSSLESRFTIGPPTTPIVVPGSMVQPSAGSAFGSFQIVDDSTLDITVTSSTVAASTSGMLTVSAVLVLPDGFTYVASGGIGTLTGPPGSWFLITSNSAGSHSYSFTFNSVPSTSPGGGGGGGSSGGIIIAQTESTSSFRDFVYANRVVIFLVLLLVIFALGSYIVYYRRRVV